MKSICALRASGLPMHSKRFCVRMWLRRLGMTTALLLLTFGLSRSAFAGVTASILGTVKDASGAQPTQIRTSHKQFLRTETALTRSRLCRRASMN